MKFRLPKQDSATGRAIKTALQALGGFIVGLVVAIYDVPGVPETIQSYVTKHGAEVLLAVGVPVALSSGAIAFIWNYLRRDVKNY